MNGPDALLGIMALLAAEALALVAFWWRTGRGLRPAEILGQLLAGLMLMAAVRSAMVGEDPAVTWLFLTASFPAHLFDLLRRFRDKARA